MPALEQLQVSAESQRIAWEMHVRRTQDRIDFWRTRLALPTLMESERTLIGLEIEKYEGQLIPPAERGLVTVTDTKPNPLMSLVLALKEQLAELKAQITGTKTVKESDGPVSESQAAAHA